MLALYTKEDSLPNRVKPVLVQVLQQIFIVATTMTDPHFTYIANIIRLVFFFLFYPSEYAKSLSDSTLLELRDIHLFQAQL